MAGVTEMILEPSDKPFRLQRTAVRAGCSPDLVNWLLRDFGIYFGP